MREHPVPEDDSVTGRLPSQQEGSEDDMGGHMATDSAPGVRAEGQPDFYHLPDKAAYRVQDDDVEGHKVSGGAPGVRADKAAYRVQDDEDDDVEGHRAI